MTPQDLTPTALCRFHQNMLTHFKGEVWTYPALIEDEVKEWYYLACLELEKNGLAERIASHHPQIIKFAITPRT